MFSGQQIVAYCIMSLFVVATPLKRRDINIFRIFFVAEAPLCWRCREAEQCRVPSSA